MSKMTTKSKKLGIDIGVGLEYKNEVICFSFKCKCTKGVSTRKQVYYPSPSMTAFSEC